MKTKKSFLKRVDLPESGFCDFTNCRSVEMSSDILSSILFHPLKQNLTKFIKIFLRSNLRQERVDRDKHLLMEENHL